MRRTLVAILTSVGIFLFCPYYTRASRPTPSKHLIVPGVRIGDIALGMSKDEVLKRLGKPRMIHKWYGGGTHTLDNLPTRYRMDFGDITFEIIHGEVQKITVQSPSYTLDNGLGVGDAAETIKQAFGKDFLTDDGDLIYRDKRLEFGIDEKSRTVEEISISRAPLSHNPLPGPLVLPKIDRRPRPYMWQTRETQRLPKRIAGSDEVIGLRNRDLSKLDLRDSFEDLTYSEFDSRTLWPPRDKMPSGFDLQRIMDLGKNPGLGIRSLHKKGITGRGVRIAILDHPLLIDHQEYADRVRLYEEVHIEIDEPASSHGCMVASVAAGKTVGVAPEAELFYIALYLFDWEPGGGFTYKYLAQGINRILEINEQLPRDNKIRVISISGGLERDKVGGKEFGILMDAVRKAQAAGMLIATCTNDVIYREYDHSGVGRSTLADPDVFESYEKNLYARESFWKDPYVPPGGWCFCVPLDSRTIASPDGVDEYIFDRSGGFSKAPPYTAGVYALAVQVDPDIAPERFWALAAETGRTIEVERNGKRRRLGPIIDPVSLIRSIRAGDEPSKEKHTIRPGIGIGEIKLGMSKDEVLRTLGTPSMIYYAGKRYTLDNHPKQYWLNYGHITMEIENNVTQEVRTGNPLYTFPNGLGVGDLEYKIRQAFGDDFELRESDERDYLDYKDKGVTLVVRKKDRIVREIRVFPPEEDDGEDGAPDRAQPEQTERPMASTLFRPG